MKKSLIALALIISGAAFAQEKNSLPLPPSGNVTLTLDEFNRLTALARRPATRIDVPPFPYVIKTADVKLHVSGESVLGTIQMEGETLRSGETKVPLTIIDARAEGKALPLQQDGGMETAILPGQAEFTVTLDAGLPLEVGAGRASFSFPVPAAGSAQLAFVVPGDHTNVSVSPGLIVGRRSENGQTTVNAVLVPGQTARIWWTTREIAAPATPREVRFLSDIKTLVTVGEMDLRITSLADITVVQGEPTQFAIDIPAGYEVTGTSGATLESSEVQSGALILKVSEPAQRTHEFLISTERTINGTKADTPFSAFKDTQRETGEVLIEGEGTMELTATEGGGLKRMDLKEANPSLRSLARFPLKAAFRYHKQPAEPPSLALEWVRFPDSSVLAAIAEHAVVTTLVTSEGKSLTEVKLSVKNQGQPFLKVGLPTGASILSADVAGEKVKPVQGPDGDRVPLLRPGFRPAGTYTVSFVFMHSGAPFAKNGGSELSLPRMDVPIGLLQWEVFLPERYRVKDFGGDAMATSSLPPAIQESSLFEEETPMANAQVMETVDNTRIPSLARGQLAGVVVDQSGAVIPGAHVTVQSVDTGEKREITTNGSGLWIVSNIPSGKVRVTITQKGFRSYVRDLDFDTDRPGTIASTLSVGFAAETVTVEAASSNGSSEIERMQKEAKKNAEAQQRAASSNVLNLQQRIAGVLPIAVDVPRAGNSYRFIRPLVLDEETKVTFTYKNAAK